MGNNRRILVLDDELGPREALRMMLKSRYEVMTASTGSEALELVHTMPPDLAFLDIQMREMNGIEVLKAIKGIDASIEVIMMTAYASLETAREAMSYGVSEYLIKPFSKAEVEQAVAKALARRDESTESRYEVRALLEQMHALAEVSTQGASYQDFIQNARSLLEQSRRELNAAAATFHVLDEVQHHLVCEVIVGGGRTAIANFLWARLGAPRCSICCWGANPSFSLPRPRIFIINAWPRSYSLWDMRRVCWSLFSRATRS